MKTKTLADFQICISVPLVNIIYKFLDMIWVLTYIGDTF